MAARRHVLLYGTAGFAWERVDETERRTTPRVSISDANVTTPFDRFGLGRGRRHRGHAVRAELDRTDRISALRFRRGAGGQLSLPRLSRASGFADRAGRQSFDVVRAGLSYKFGTPIGVNAAYAKMPSAAIAASWAGFYLGVHGGYGWGENNFTTRVSTAPPVDLFRAEIARRPLWRSRRLQLAVRSRGGRTSNSISASPSIRGAAQVQYSVPPKTFTEAGRRKSKPSVRSARGWAGRRPTVCCSTGLQVSAGSASAGLRLCQSGTGRLADLVDLQRGRPVRLGRRRGRRDLAARRQLDRPPRISALRVSGDCKLRCDYQCLAAQPIRRRRPSCRCSARRRVLQVRRPGDSRAGTLRKGAAACVVIGLGRILSRGPCRLWLAR